MRLRRAVRGSLLAVLLSNPLAAAEPAQVVLRSGIVTAPDEAARGELEHGGPAVLRFAAPVGAQTRAAVAGRGMRLIAPLDAHSFLAMLPPGAARQAAGIPGLLWAAPYEPALRIAPEIAIVQATDTRERIPVTLHVWPDVDLEAVASRLRMHGLQVHGTTPGGPERSGRLVVVPTPAQIVALRDTMAAWPETFWIGRRPVYRLLNDGSASLLQSGMEGAATTPVFDRGLRGEGQIVGILDTGIDADMCFFRDPERGLPPTVVGFGTGAPDPLQRKIVVVDFLAPGENPGDVTDWDTQDHGTHVAGSVAGDNLVTPGRRDAIDGMAPAAKLVIQDGGYGVDNCADLPAIGCPAADLVPFFDQAYRQGARIHSNSWGDRENFTPYNIYSDGSEDADAFMWSHPDFLLVFAAGNNGGNPGTVASPATAKNVLAVGATQHDRSAGRPASFSSNGPTHDGRIKPDVTAPGENVFSANNDLNVTTQNCGNQGLSGTSMACPTAAGMAALVRQYYEDGFHPSGRANASDARTPSAALVKATLIASATAMEEVATPPPSNEQGWGRLHLDEALYFAGDRRRTFAAEPPGGFDEPADPPQVHTLTVLDATEPLEVVLAWTDFPSSPAAAVNLVNDLDLEVQAPSGALYRGNVLSGGVSQPGGIADRRNNVEMVRILAPETGQWTVTVRPFAIPQPEQRYALVATGRLPAAGVALERTGLDLDDAVGGDADGVLEPGEWVDLRVTVLDSGDTAAADVRVRVESLTPVVEVAQAESIVGDLEPGQQAATTAPHPRIHLKLALPCTQPISLRFTYVAGGQESTEVLTLGTGTEQVFLRDHLETNLGLWAHVAAESTAATGNWVRGDPDGTTYQPERDATEDPGLRALFTALNPTYESGDDVDGGVVVARSGSYDLTGHPQARLRISRWFAFRDVGVDAGDFFELHVRAGAASPDVLLERLGNTASTARWVDASYRIADFVTPGPGIQLRVAASDGPAAANLLEAAIDEVVFYDPICTSHDPPPAPVTSLRADRAGADVVLRWTRPAVDPAHGETSRYRIYRSTSVSSGFGVRAELADAGPTVTWTDPGAASPSPPFYAWLVISGNAAGDSEPAP